MVVLGDLHLGKTGDSILIDGVSSRIINTLNRVAEAATFARENDMAVILAGDVFDSEYPRPYVIERFMKVIRDSGVTFYIIPGNHDCGVTNHSLMYLREWGGKVVLIDTPEIHTIEGKSVMFLPHVPRNTMEKVIDKHGSYLTWAAKLAEGQQIDIVIGHAHISGAKNASDIEIEAGSALEFDPTEFLQFKLGVFGHIHKHQTLKKKMLYTGPVSTNSFDEAEIQKGFVVIPDNFSSWEINWFETPETEYKHVTIDLVSKDDVEFSKAKVKQIADGKLLKLTVYAKDAMQVDKQAMTKTFNEFGQVMRFETVICNDIGKIQQDDTADVFETVDYPSALKEYLKSKENLPKPQMLAALKLGQEVIEEVLNAQRAAS